MKFRARVVAAMLVGIATGLVAAPLRADDAIGVRYHAPLGCPGAPDFFAEVKQRNQRLRAAAPPDPAQLLVTIERVTIEQTGSTRFSGRLERVTATGTVGVREIAGESCKEVATALALITALTADLVAVADTHPAATEPSPPTPDSIEGANGNAASIAPVDASSPKRNADDKPSAVATDGVAASAVTRWRWQVGVDGALVSGVTPSPLLGGTVFAQIGGRSSAIVVPSVRLSASLSESSWSSSVPSSQWGARFLLAVGALDGCPIQLGDPLGLSLSPCARITAGLLRASGSGGASGRSESLAWADLGGVLRGHWQWTRSLFAGAEAELFVPLVDPYTFDFKNPNETAYVVHDVGLRIGAGLGIVFR